MKTKWGIAAAAALALSMTGCGGNASAEQASVPPSTAASQSSSNTPTPTPTPTAMSTEAAGKFYLAEICKMNASTDALNQTVQVVPLNLAQARQQSAEKRDTVRGVIQAFSDPAVLWPVTVAPDMAALEDGFYTIVAETESLSTQKTEPDFWAVWNAGPTAAKDPVGAIAQKVRLKLGLPADTFGSCGIAAQ